MLEFYLDYLDSAKPQTEELFKRIIGEETLKHYQENITKRQELSSILAQQPWDIVSQIEDLEGCHYMANDVETVMAYLRGAQDAVILMTAQQQTAKLRVMRDEENLLGALLPFSNFKEVHA